MKFSEDSVTFPVTYRQAVDYPVDLYYVMDMSHSMEDDKQKLSELGALLGLFFSFVLDRYPFSNCCIFLKTENLFDYYGMFFQFCKRLLTNELSLLLSKTTSNCTRFSFQPSG